MVGRWGVGGMGCARGWRLRILMAFAPLAAATHQVMPAAARLPVRDENGGVTTQRRRKNLGADTPVIKSDIGGRGQEPAIVATRTRFRFFVMDRPPGGHPVVARTA